MATSEDPAATASDRHYSRIDKMSSDLIALFGEIGYTLAPLLAIYLVFNFYMFSSFEVSLDEEITPFFGGQGYRWLALDRFGLFLYERLVLGFTTVPFLPYFLAGLFLALAYVGVARTLGEDPRSLKMLVLFPLFSSFPTWYFLAQFATNISGAALAVVFLSLAMQSFSFVITNWKDGDFYRSIPGWRHLVLSILAGSIAVGMYQTFALSALIMLAAVVIVGWNGHSPTRLILLGLLAAATSVMMLLLSKFISFTLRKIYSVEFSPYLDRVTNPDAIVENPLSVISKLFESVRLFLFGSADIYGSSIFILPIVLAVCLILSLAAVMRASSPWKSVLVLLALVAVLVAPFVHEIYWGARPFIRSYVALPFAIWFIAYFAWTHSRSAAGLLVLALCVLLHFQVLKAISLLASSNALAREHDVILTGAIIGRVSELLPASSRPARVPLVFHGRRNIRNPLPRPEGTTTGRSIYEFNSTYRIVSLMNLFGFHEFIDGSKGLDADEKSRLFENMKPWPDPGSIRVDRDKILIKLGR